jgi:hypothetical protein
LSLELNMVDKDQGTVSGNGRKHRQRAMWLWLVTEPELKKSCDSVPLRVKVTLSTADFI